MLVSLTASAQRYEKVPFGDFEQWAVRYITESKVIGGQEKIMYMVGPTDTIRDNVVYSSENTDWASSNVYAKLMGVVKTNTNVMPDRGPTGTCAKLFTQMASCKVIGLLNINVLAGGCVFWGEMQEPVSNLANPCSVADWGIPFNKRPKAMVLNYKAIVPNTGKLIKSTTFCASEFDGYDSPEIVFVLENLQEDASGNVHIKRVGTAIRRIEKTSEGWVMDFRIPVIYGDARNDKDYKPYMDLIKAYRNMYLSNSKGKKKCIVEEEWADPDCPVTHAMMWFASGSCGAFIGALDNVLWVDEIRLEY